MRCSLFIVFVIHHHSFLIPFFPLDQSHFLIIISRNIMSQLRVRYDVTNY